ncbi:MAG: class III poly(R)-hydroxyalkanoic acid synthase subunit PhaE [Chloroflexales bacterium]|nr:class III poly(R)-hydroxyalkanoic acid synthase subunit PhaE [Chloroflexales bacterium]
MAGKTQAESMMDMWQDAQKQLWDSWSKTVQTVSASTFFYPDLLEQWRKLAAQGLEAWTAVAIPRSQNVSRQLMAAQAATMRFLEFSADAWKAMAPKLEAGGDWQSVLHSYTEQFSRQLVRTPADFAQASQDVNELWKLYLEEMQSVLNPWVESLQHSPAHMGEALTGGSSELVQLTNLYWDAYERTFGRLVQSPRMGFNRELEEKLLRGFDAWTDFRRVSMDYQIVLADTWSRVFERVMRELVTLNGQGKQIQSLRDLLRLWTDVADKELEAAFQSETYVKAQSRLFNATMQYRLREQAIVETYLKMSYIPTRSEVDEVHRNIYELRKELKALKKELRVRNGQESRPEAPVEREQTAKAESKPARPRRSTRKKAPETTTSE